MPKDPVITEHDLGWVAGVVDLKGTLLYKKNQDRRTPQVILYVQSTKMPIITRLNTLTGTKVEMKEPRPLRDFMRKVCTEHCPDSHSHVVEYPIENLTMPANARWTLTGAAMAVVVWNIYDYLIDKKEYKEVVDFVFENIGIIGQGSARTRQSLRRLKLLGWALPDHYMPVMD